MLIYSRYLIFNNLSNLNLGLQGIHVRNANDFPPSHIFLENLTCPKTWMRNSQYYPRLHAQLSCLTCYGQLTQIEITFSTFGLGLENKSVSCEALD